MKSKTKNKLWLLAGTSFVALMGALPLMSLRCVRQNKNITQKRFVRSWASTYTSQAFMHDISTSYGSFQPTTNTQETGGLLFRKQGLNEPNVSNDEKILQPTFSKYRLELAKEVVLTMKDGTKKVYNNDKAEIKPSADKADGTYSKINVQATSNDEQSINNPKFLEDLRNAKKIQVTVKENTHWTDHQGRKTKYRVSPRDFYYSWLRTAGLTTEKRHELGGNAELDKIANESLCEQNSPYYTSNSSYNNEYLYRVFNVNSSNFYDESKFITEVNGVNGIANGTKALTFDLIDESKGSEFDRFFKKCTIGSYEMSAAPSKYIDDMNKNSSYTAYNYIDQDSTSAIKDKLEQIKDTKAYQAGLYWYGVSAKNTLYAGPYYALPRNGVDRVIKANQNYWDQEWVNRKDKLEELVWRYQANANTDKKIFNDNQYKEYLNGDVTSIAFSQLSDTQKAEIIKKRDELGLKYSKTFNNSSPTYRFLTVPYVRKNKKDSYLFNDAYAKLMWGSTREELSNGEGNIDSYASGLGLSMRTLLNAAVNWNYFEDYSTNRVQKPWLAKMAENSSMGGKDQDSNPKSPIDYYEQVNTLMGLDENGNKVTSITPEQNINWINKTAEVSEKLKSAEFEKIKAAVKKVLDKFEEQNPQYKGQKYQYTSYYQWANIEAQLKQAREKLEKLYAELDPRLEIKYQDTPNPEDKTFNDVRDNGVSGMEFAGWNYDFDSTASGFDGLSWSNQLFPLLTYLADKKPENVKKAFPQLFKLAEKLVEYGTTNYHGSIPFKDLYKIKNSRMYTFTRGGYLCKWKETAGKYDLDFSSGKAELFNNATDVYEFSATFWLNYFKQLTNDDIAKLMAELTSYMSTYSESGVNSISKQEFTPYLINKHYQQPIVSGLPLFHGDIKMVNIKKK